MLELVELVSISKLGLRRSTIFPGIYLVVENVCKHNAPHQSGSFCFSRFKVENRFFFVEFVLFGDIVFLVVDEDLSFEESGKMERGIGGARKEVGSVPEEPPGLLGFGEGEEHNILLKFIR